MPNLAQLVTELQKPAYAARVAAGSNGELVTEVNAAKPFSKRWRPVAVDEFKAIVAGKLGALTSQQREVLRILLQGDSVDLEDSDIRAALEVIFTDTAVRTALAAVAREDDLVSLRDVRDAVRQIPAALVNQ